MGRKNGTSEIKFCDLIYQHDMNTCVIVEKRFNLLLSEFLIERRGESGVPHKVLPGNRMRAENPAGGTAALTH